jgi:K+-sensing histidine kinase KdpD
MSKPRRSLWSEPSAISRYAIAVLSVAIAMVVAEILTRLLQTEPIASSLLCAVMFAAWFGVGPGLLAIALSLFAFHYYLLPPINSFGFKYNLFAVDLAELPRLALFSITSLFVNSVSSAQRGAKEAALQAEAKAARAEREIRLVTDTIPALVWRAFPDGANFGTGTRLGLYRCIPSRGSSVGQKSYLPWNAARDIRERPKNRSAPARR